ncbi:hypothetical protein PoB_003659300 [Plakobranchus ocellatus]|uniref:Uncharacterized protein n=1 Tax=Plakobranchus ocellatus TaxID=259542 RepID=A0AAV4ARV9_9GAST|nr:hypothetical protein PoB_003659300 [Plakobranchus ocellatus]
MDAISIVTSNMFQEAIWDDELRNNPDSVPEDSGERNDQLVDYVDDPFVHTSTREDDVRTLREQFERLPQANFTVRPTK